MSFLHVVIPVYNALPFLRETVASILDQPYKEIDVVLVDDGSSDGSGALCDELAAQNERVSVIHQDNAGVSAARNAGIAYFLNQNSQGYLAFLDADDLWCPDTVTDEIMQNINHDGMELFVFGSTCSNSKADRFAHPYVYQKKCADGGNKSVWSVRNTFCAVFYPLKELQKWSIRFINGLKYSEDKIFLMQCVFFAEKVQFLPDILHIYRDNRSSAMKKVNTITPIDYYLPIINGWIASDEFVNSWENVSGRHITAGCVLAGIYFLDMAAEHYMRWGKKKDLDQIFTKHPRFDLFLDMKPQEVNAQQFKNHELLLKHPLLYKLKYNLIGIGWFAARLLLRNRWVFQFRQHRKYPLVEMPINR